MNIHLHGYYKVSIAGEVAEIEPALPAEWGQGTERSVSAATGPEGMFDALSRERTRADGGRILSVGADIIRERFKEAIDDNARRKEPCREGVEIVLHNLLKQVLGEV